MAAAKVQQGLGLWVHTVDPIEGEDVKVNMEQ
jgi:hypothetical protein